MTIAPDATFDAAIEAIWQGMQGRVNDSYPYTYMPQGSKPITEYMYMYVYHWHTTTPVKRDILLKEQNGIA